jgi:hypothetical protein
MVRIVGRAEDHRHLNAVVEVPITRSPSPTSSCSTAGSTTWIGAGTARPRRYRAATGAGWVLFTCRSAGRLGRMIRRHPTLHRGSRAVFERRGPPWAASFRCRRHVHYMDAPDNQAVYAHVSSLLDAR